MNNNSYDTTADFSAVNNRQSFLEQTKLSRVPKMPPRASNLVTATKEAAVCVNCQTSLRNESAFTRRILVCPPCLTIYNKIDNAITKANENRAYSDFGDK